MCSEIDPVLLDLPCPPSVNVTRKLNKAGLRQLAAWQSTADKLVTYQWAQARLKKISRPRHLLNQPVEIAVRLSTKLRIDLDNSLKTLIDYLVRVEIISDDRKKFVKRITVEWCAPSEAPEGVSIAVLKFSTPSTAEKISP
jgi:Holliday junction resolvase RusA-like endonuclease